MIRWRERGRGLPLVLVAAALAACAAGGGARPVPVLSEPAPAGAELVRRELLIVLHDGSPRSRAALEEIRTLYKQVFEQESVLIMSAPARASF